MSQSVKFTLDGKKFKAELVRGLYTSARLYLFTGTEWEEIESKPPGEVFDEVSGISEDELEEWGREEAAFYVD